MSAYTDASLIMVPSGYKDGTLYSAKPTNGDGDFTFSRGSNLAATRINSDGLIEKGRENLFLHSNDFSQGAWSQNTVGVTRTSSSVTDPNGGTNAWEITTTATTDTHRIGHNINSGPIKTVSFYAKANGYDYVRVWSWFGGNTNSNYFYLSGDGSVGGNGYGGIRKIESLGNGWYRCQCLIDGANVDTIVISPAPNQNVANGTNSYLGDGTSGIYLFQAQLEAGLVATDYIETGASTAQAGILEDMPRLDYSGGATCGSLLLEPQRTNLLAQSEYFDTTPYSKVNATVTTNDITSPEGQINATKLISTSGASRVETFPTLSDNTNYTASIFAKRGDVDYIMVNFREKSGNQHQTFFDLANGTKGTTNGSPISSSIEAVGDYYRVTLTINSSSGGSTPRLQYLIANTDNNVVTSSGEYIYVYGAMLEEGSYATSYIPTYGASVTRGADSCTNADVSSLLGSGVGTAFIDMVVNGQDTQGNIPLTIGTGTSNLIYLWIQTSQTIRYEAYTGGTLEGAVNTASGFYTYGDRIKVALVWADNDFAMYINGTQIGTDTSGTAPTPTKLWLGEYTSGNYKGGSINQAILFPTRLSNDELATLTTL